MVIYLKNKGFYMDIILKNSELKLIRLGVMSCCDTNVSLVIGIGNILTSDMKIS